MSSYIDGRGNEVEYEIWVQPSYELKISTCLECTVNYSRTITQGVKLNDSRKLTGAYIRDYIIGRFLKSREEIVIKSPVCREITLDSKLH